MWNGLLRGAKAEQLATTQLGRARSRKARGLVTLYIPGTIAQTMHWSWNATYSNAVVRSWLFQQVERRAVRHFALALHQVSDVFVADVVGLDVGVDQAAPAVEKPAAQHVTAGETPEWIDDDPGDARALAGAVSASAISVA